MQWVSAEPGLCSNSLILAASFLSIFLDNRPAKGYINNMSNAQKKVNYTDEQVSLLRSMYTEKGNEGLDEIAKALDKSVRSVRAKLVRDGLYVAPDKPVKQAKEDGPSKKELLNQLDALGFEAKGFEGATKDAISRLILRLS